MSPTLLPGDIVIYRPLNKGALHLKEGVLIVASHPLRKNTLMVKRVFTMHSSG